MSSVEKTRFRKVLWNEIPRQSLPSGKLRNWQGDAGEFLARIWSLYGGPHEIIDEGFSYLFQDEETDLILNVYSGASGPAYSVSQTDQEQAHALCDVFDKLLENAELADCAIEFETDFGVYRVGARNGVAFEEEIDSRGDE